jgi:hypothetical protein
VGAAWSSPYVGAMTASDWTLLAQTCNLIIYTVTPIQVFTDALCDTSILSYWKTISLTTKSNEIQSQSNSRWVSRSYNSDPRTVFSLCTSVTVPNELRNRILQPYDNHLSILSVSQFHFGHGNLSHLKNFFGIPNKILYIEATNLDHKYVRLTINKC